MSVFGAIDIAAADAVSNAPASSMLFEWSIMAAGGMLGVAIVLVTVRLLRGPTLADRVVALDLLGTVTAGAIGLYAVASNQPVHLFVAISIALLLFVGTVAFAWYIERTQSSPNAIDSSSETAP